jgi:hypothetical protein
MKGSPHAMDDRESAWRELDKDIDLYKFYLELLLKAAAFVGSRCIGIKLLVQASCIGQFFGFRNK